MSEHQSDATPAEEAVARLLCTDAGHDPEAMASVGEPETAHTPAGRVFKAVPTIPLWHFWVPTVKAAFAALQAAHKD